MVLGVDSVIDLARLARAMRSLVELQYVERRPGDSFYDAHHDSARDAAISDFARYVYDHQEDEVRLRNAVVFLLNLPDDDFAPLVRAVGPPLAGERSPQDVRRFLQDVWQRTWAPWRVELFDAEDYDVRAPDA